MISKQRKRIGFIISIRTVPFMKLSKQLLKSSFLVNMSLVSSWLIIKRYHQNITPIEAKRSQSCSEEIENSKCSVETENSQSNTSVTQTTKTFCLLSSPMASWLISSINWLGLDLQKSSRKRNKILRSKLQQKMSCAL